MRRLSYLEFQQELASYDKAVYASQHLAKFCSTAPWQCSAYEHLHGFEFGIDAPRDTLIVEHEKNWLLFAERRERIFYPFESAWMFGCPLIGEPEIAIELLEKAALIYQGSGCGFVISGFLNDSEMHKSLIRLGKRARRFEEFATTDCLSLDLSSGADKYLANRSRSFRKGIRQMKKIDDVEFLDASAELPEKVFPRIFDIQARSYKSSDDNNIFSNHHYESFYRTLYERLFQLQMIRTTFLQIAGRDVAYIMGGVCGAIYRGFQMSYDDEFRPYAPGNRLQLENIRRMAAEGITHYDLGMHSPYKERWMDKWENFKGAFIVL